MNRLRLLSAFAAFGAIAVTLGTRAAHGSPSAAESAPAISTAAYDGEQVFTQRCSQCHAVYEGQGSFGPNLYHETRKTTDRKNATQIRKIIVEGKGKMPAFKEKLTDDQVKELLAYIRTL
jgi:mono/diheme cytochrome c family protein